MREIGSGADRPARNRAIFKWHFMTRLLGLGLTGGYPKMIAATCGLTISPTIATTDELTIATTAIVNHGWSPAQFKIAIFYSSFYPCLKFREP